MLMALEGVQSLGCKEEQGKAAAAAVSTMEPDSFSFIYLIDCCWKYDGPE